MHPFLTIPAPCNLHNYTRQLHRGRTVQLYPPIILYRMYCTVRSCTTGTALVPNLRNTAQIMNGASIDHACSCGAHTTLLEVHISQQSEGRVVQWHQLLPRPHTCFVQRALMLLTVKAPHSCTTDWSPVHTMPWTWAIPTCPPAACCRRPHLRSSLGCGVSPTTS